MKKCYVSCFFNKKYTNLPILINLKTFNLMKKVFFIASIFLVASSTSFAIEKEKKEEKTEQKEIVSDCCTATLTYNGQEVDRETICGMISTGDNCNMAAHNLLLRHPDTGLSDPLPR